MHKYLGKGVRKQENITDMAIAANTDQKRENLLNLSLSVSEEERMRSESLDPGTGIVKWLWYTEGAGISGGLCYKLTGN